MNQYNDNTITNSVSHMMCNKHGNICTEAIHDHAIVLYYCTKHSVIAETYLCICMMVKKETLHALYYCLLIKGTGTKQRQIKSQLIK